MTQLFRDKASSSCIFSAHLRGARRRTRRICSSCCQCRPASWFALESRSRRAAICNTRPATSFSAVALRAAQQAACSLSGFFSTIAGAEGRTPAEHVGPATAATADPATRTGRAHWRRPAPVPIGRVAPAIGRTRSGRRRPRCGGFAAPRRQWVRGESDAGTGKKKVRTLRRRRCAIWSDGMEGLGRRPPSSPGLPGSPAGAGGARGGARP